MSVLDSGNDSSFWEQVQMSLAVSAMAESRLRELENDVLAQADSTAANVANADVRLAALVFGWSSLGKLNKARVYGSSLADRAFGNERRLRALLSGAMRLLDDARYTDAAAAASLADIWVEEGGFISLNLKVQWAVFWAHLGRYDRAMTAIESLRAGQRRARISVVNLLLADQMKELASQQLSLLMSNTAWRLESFDTVALGVASMAAAGNCDNVSRIIQERAIAEQPPLWAIAREASVCAPEKFTTSRFADWLDAEWASRLWSLGKREAALGLCENVYAKRGTAHRSIVVARALHRCGTLWIANRDDAKAAQAHASLFAYFFEGEEIAAQLSKRALRDSQVSQARKYAWMVRCHPCREALLEAVRSRTRRY